MATFIKITQNCLGKSLLLSRHALTETTTRSLSHCSRGALGNKSDIISSLSRLSIKTIPASFTGGRHFHSTPSTLANYRPHNEPKNWLLYNDVLYPPQKPGEPRRPAEIVHQRPNIKYSTKKLWYISSMIRGMSVDEALKQLSFYERKGAEYCKQTILEAQEMAVRDHNVEFKSNLWIEDSFVRKAKTVYGWRRHARGKMGRIHYRYTHYFLRLREGRPPKHYYPPRPTGNEMLEGYLENLRNRRIAKSL